MTGTGGDGSRDEDPVGGEDPVERDDPDDGSLLVDVTRDPIELATGTLVGIAGLLFLVEPVVDPIPVGGARLRPVVLSGIVFALAMTVGGVGFLARKRTRVGLGHAGMAAGWILVVLGTAVGAIGLLVVGVAVIAGTGLYLAAQSREA